MNPSNPDPASVSEWIAAMAQASASPKDRVLREVRAMTKSAYDAGDVGMLPRAPHIARAAGVGQTCARYCLQDLAEAGLVTRIGSRYAQWAAS